MRQGLIVFWYDRRIVPGDEWKTAIADRLEDADIILLLISAYFISSDYCYKIELGRALQRHQERTAVVIPIYVRACDWDGLDFAALQGLPPNAVPVNDYEDRDKAWALVSKGVREARIDLFRRAALNPNYSISANELSASDARNYELLAYFRYLVSSYAKGPWSDRAVALKVMLGDQIVSVQQALQDWTNWTNRYRAARILFLTGEAGSGKTWAFKYFAAWLASRRLDGKTDVPCPLYVPFRSLQNSEVISSISAAVPEGQRVIEAFSSDVPIVVLLDGLDEMVVNSTDDAIRMVIDLLRSTPRNTGIAVSCRPSVAAEAIRGLQSFGQDTLVYKMLDLTESEIKVYLASSESPVKVNRRLAKLIRSPFMLPLAEKMEKILLHWASDHTPFPHEIYALSIETMIREAQERERPIASVGVDTLLAVMTDLAAQMFPRMTLQAAEAKVPVADDRKFDVINSLVAAGLLALDSRELISFSHQSFFDFFFARLLHQDFLDWEAQHLARVNLIYWYNVNRFLIPMLLQDSRRSLSQQAAEVRRKLERGATRADGQVITKPIPTDAFRTFVHDTGWRQDTGFGHWLVYAAPDQTEATSDPVIQPEIESIFDRQSARKEPAVSLSWYDAHQFASWVGGRLPFKAELQNHPANAKLEREWTADWFDELHGLVSVVSFVDSKPCGVNPDVRSAKIGFRITFTN
jgi:hypothetical protein